MCNHPFWLYFSHRPFDAKNPFLAPVTVNRKLNKGGDRHLMHLELDISGSKIRYSSTAHACVNSTGVGDRRTEHGLTHQLHRKKMHSTNLMTCVNNMDEVKRSFCYSAASVDDVVVSCVSSATLIVASSLVWW